MPKYEVSYDYVETALPNGKQAQVSRTRVTRLVEAKSEGEAENIILKDLNGPALMGKGIYPSAQHFDIREVGAPSSAKDANSPRSSNNSGGGNFESGNNNPDVALAGALVVVGAGAVVVTGWAAWKLTKGIYKAGKWAAPHVKNISSAAMEAAKEANERRKERNAKAEEAKKVEEALKKEELENKGWAAAVTKSFKLKSSSLDRGLPVGCKLNLEKMPTYENGICILKIAKDDKLIEKSFELKVTKEFAATHFTLSQNNAEEQPDLTVDGKTTLGLIAGLAAICMGWGFFIYLAMQLPNNTAKKTAATAQAEPSDKDVAK